MQVFEVNNIGYQRFYDIFYNVVERCPLAAAVLWTSWPFNDTAHIIQVLESFLDFLSMQGMLSDAIHIYDIDIITMFRNTLVWE